MSGFCSKARRGRRGYILIFGALMLFFILVPAAGLAVDAGMMYLTQTLLSAAADGAALAGARALSRGSDDATQRANAEATANAYLHANFPSGYMWSTNLRVTSVAATDSQYIRSITTTARVDLPLVFLRIFRSTSTTVSTTSKTTRRDANLVIVMDRSGSLQSSGSCGPLKSAAVNFVDKFAEGRDNLGLITFATSSTLDAPLSATFKTNVEAKLNAVVCANNTNTSHAVWQGYDQLVALNQPGALNAMVIFTDGLPTAVTEDFPIKVNPNTCTPKNVPTGLTGVLTDGPNGLYNPSAAPPPTVISGTHNCAFTATSDLQYAPTVDHWGNSLVTTGYKSVTYSGAGLKISSSNIDNISTNAADHAAMRVRRGDPDPAQANRSLSGVVIFTIGLGSDADTTLLKRMANDVSLSPNPVAAGANGKYEYAGDATQLNDAFTRVASEVLRLAK
jgi:Flp pilus assembly protein TadG